MAYKVLVLAMLITLHATALLFASLFTYKWLVDPVRKRDTGVFGICDYLNKSTVSSMLHREGGDSSKQLFFRAKSSDDSIGATTNSDLMSSDEGSSVYKKEKGDMLLLSRRSNSMLYPTSSLPSVVKNVKEDAKYVRNMNEEADDNDDDIIFYQKCFQLLWPTRIEAFKYLSSKIKQPYTTIKVKHLLIVLIF